MQVLWRSRKIGNKVLIGLLVSLTASLLLDQPVSAQVAADGTLSTSVAEPVTNNFVITGGTQVGTNLFHSFGQFSIPTLGSAFFNNSLAIQNILARVTGGSASNIDGTIRANGTANLFLLNPAGILFGPSASLNLGGSFVASTANTIVFTDGTKFSATDTTPAPLLTVSAPLGLQMGNNPAPIQVQGTGYALIGTSSLGPITQAPSPSQLQVQPGKTLALVGGDLTLTGATLNAPQGRIELGSLSGPGLVSLTPISQGYQLGYENGQSFGDIQLTQKSVLTIGAFPLVGAFSAGSAQVQGRTIQFRDGSLVFSQNFGSTDGGEIFFQAAEGIDMIGTTANAQIRSGIRSETLNTGASSNIRIITPRLTVSQGAGINANAFGSASSGNIQINAGTIEVSGFSPLNPAGVSSLTTSTRSAKSAGNISITSNNLLVSGGAGVSSVTFAAGSSGQVTIRSNSVTVTGDNPAGLYSNVSAVTFGTGNAQTLTLDTARLQILDGGVVATTSFLIGQAGNLEINATESILISGRSQLNNSSINSAVIPPEPLIQQLFGLPKVLSGNAGNIHIVTPNLTLTNGGAVSVTNQGTGDGGDIKITADRIFLNQQGSIQAQTATGNGGDITLQVDDLLLLRRNSLISATSGSTGNGGNITINATFIVGVAGENSDITANAVRGKGGNIQITTRGIFGLKFRPQLTPESDITASSQFGVSGTVQINTISLDPSTGLVGLPTQPTDSSQQIATGCANSQGNRFIATGRGGLPQNPTQGLVDDRTWDDTRDLSEYRDRASSQGMEPLAQTSTTGPVEASLWKYSADGSLELVATQPTGANQAVLSCAAIPVPSH